MSTLKKIDSRKEWSELLSSISEYDFYHTYDYHHLSSKNDEEPMLLQYKNKSSILLLPLLIREIPGTKYKDATSVYGYAGPLFNTLEALEYLADFRDKITVFLKNENIICVFSSLNPFITKQETILFGLGHIETLGNVVNIDLGKDVNTQYSLYSSMTRRHIKKLRRLCDLKIGTSKKDVELFIEMYHQNMKRKKASKSYLFSEKYFQELTESKEFETELIFATLKETGEVISSALMIRTNSKIIQYHLSGTRDKFLHLSPLRLLIDEIRLRGANDGYVFFNLGGGLKSKDDSLFEFKSSFSQDFKKFKVWKYVVNEKIYQELCTVKNTQDLHTSNNYFPLYRYSKSIE